MLPRPNSAKLAIDNDGLHTLMLGAWPDKAAAFAPERIPVLRPGFCRVLHEVTADDLRPGDTVAGPTLMTLADTAAYALLLAHLGVQGETALAVTSSLSIDFLRRPVGPVLVADCELVKLGRSLAVCRVTMASAAGGAEPEMGRPEAIATVTYSLSLV